MEYVKSLYTTRKINEKIKTENWRHLKNKPTAEKESKQTNKKRQILRSIEKVRWKVKD